MLLIVPTERHVERMAKGGIAVLTRAKLRRRLLDALAPEVAFASAIETRIAFEQAMHAVAPGDPMLAPLARDGGEAWMRTLDALDAAIGTLRAAGTRMESLDAIAKAGGTAGRRARALRSAMGALDASLAAAKLVDVRSAGLVLAERLQNTRNEAVTRALGGDRVTARYIVTWNGTDVAWWRALDAALVTLGGGARIELPSFDSPLDPNRDRDPLEVVAEELARALDGAPESMRIDATLGDLRAAGPVPDAMRARVEVRQAADAQAQARAVVDAVRVALDRGTPLDAIAIGLPRSDDETLGPIRAALDDAKIAAHEPLGAAVTDAGSVSLALRVLAMAARGLDRAEIAGLLRSRYVDGRRLAATADGRDASRALGDLARALESSPTSVGADAIAALEATARSHGEDEDAQKVDARGVLARRVGTMLSQAIDAKTRGEHAAAARAIWGELGLDATRSRGARTTLAGDGVPFGIARAELRAFARDAGAWERLTSTLDAYEEAAARLGAARTPIAGHVFRHELALALDASASPGAARAAAVRLAPLAELAGESLALLVVIDANEGVLPRTAPRDALLSDAVASSLRAADAALAPPLPAARSAREMAGLALAASAAERIVFAYRTRDEQSGLLAPAPLVAWLERGGVPSSSWRASPLDGAATTPREALLRRLAADPGCADELSPRAARRARIERAREAFFELGGEAGPLQGALHGEPALSAILTHETGGIDRPMAVTALESIARCAFQGFASQVLRAREKSTVRELPDARESGTLAHAALAAAFTATKDLWPVRPRDASAIRVRAMEAVDALVRVDEAASTLRKLALARLREGVAAVIDWSLADDAWDFALAESRFGDREASWPPLRLDDGRTVLLLRGSIDRVDVGHGRAAVRAIDYKSSRTSVEGGMKNLGTTVFQIAVYARAASDAFRFPEREGLYVPTQRRDIALLKPNDKFVALWRDLHAADSALTKVESNALAIVRRLRDGTLVPKPADDHACDSCAMSGGCRKPRFAIAPPEEPTP